MKEFSELAFPENLKYAEDHEWAEFDGDKVRIGISDYAQDHLGDITFLELPETGDSFKKGDEFGVIESTKAASELYMPVGGEIVNVNTELADSPGLVNEDPYGAGWIIEVKPDDPKEMETLLTSAQYRELVEGLD